MTTPWERARDLALRQWPDERIVGALVGDGMEDAEAESLVERGRTSLERARDEGKGMIQDRTWKLAMGQAECDAQQWQALYALGRAHVGYGETHDAAQLREWLRRGKAAAKGGKLKAVG